MTLATIDGTKMTIREVLNHCPEQYERENLDFRIQVGLKEMWDQTGEEYRPFRIDLSNGGWVILTIYSAEPSPYDYLDEDGNWPDPLLPEPIIASLYQSTRGAGCGEQIEYTPNSDPFAYTSIPCQQLG